MELDMIMVHLTNQADISIRYWKKDIVVWLRKQELMKLQLFSCTIIIQTIMQMLIITSLQVQPFLMEAREML